MKKKVLLIADDEEMNRRIISRFLKNDFEILEAENGKEALDILHSKKVDALLLDIIMPKMDGLEVLGSMKADTTLGNVAVLVATSTMEKTERTALSLGADDVVSKPYDPVVIRKRIQNILAIKAIDEQNEMLKNDDLEAVLREKEAALYDNLREIRDKIIQLSDILEKNKDNPDLILEIIKDIRIEAKNMTCITERK